MDLSSFKDFIATLGFPIFVAGYLLLRTDPLLKKVHEALVELTTLIKNRL